MSVPPQNTTQPPPIVLTIPTQNDTKSEKEHILKLFPKRTILIFSIIQLVCAGLAGILQVGKFYFEGTFLISKSISLLSDLKFEEPQPI